MLTPSSDREMQHAARRTEFFWLCDECSSAMTITFTPGIGIKTLPVARTKAAPAAKAAAAALV